MIRTSRRIQRLIYWLMCLLALLPIGINFAQWYSVGMPLPYRFVYETNNMPALLYLTIPVAEWIGAGNVVWMMTAIITMSLTASRGGLLGWYAMTLAQRRAWLLVPLASGVCALIAIAVAQGAGVAVGGTMQSSVGFRLEAWRIAFEMWLRSPLFGHGWGSYQQAMIAAHPDWHPYGHAHNMYLTLMAEWGLLWLWPAWLYWRFVVRRWLAERYTPGLAALSGLLVHSLFDMPLSSPIVACLLACITLIRFEEAQ